MARWDKQEGNTGKMHLLWQRFKMRLKTDPPRAAINRHQKQVIDSIPSQALDAYRYTWC